LVLGLTNEVLHTPTHLALWLVLSLTVVIQAMTLALTLV